MNAKYNEDDWGVLCAATDALFAEYGSRPRAFQEACRRNPHLNGTPPGTSQAPATPGATQGPPEDSPIVRACEAAARLAAKTAGTGAGKAQAPPATPTPDDPLGRAVERLLAAGQATAEADVEASPLLKACARLAGK